MSNDVERIIIRKGFLVACGASAVEVAHQSYPEMRVTDMHVRQAVEHLAKRLASDLDAVSSPARRKRAMLALKDIREFIEHEPLQLPRSVRAPTHCSDCAPSGPNMGQQRRLVHVDSAAERSLPKPVSRDSASPPPPSQPSRYGRELPASPRAVEHHH